MSTTANFVTRQRIRIVVKVVFVLLSLFVVAGLCAPWINGNYWRTPIRRHLEALLGRSVAFEDIHFTLFSGPGLTLDNVIVGEDPRYGLEPFAFVSQMRVRLRLDRMLLGDMRISSLRLEDASLNFVKRSEEGWNVIELVRRLVAPRRSPLNLFPVLEVVGGRVDFKLGTRKTTLYLLDTDFSLYPQRSGKLFVEFTGSPARTDRSGNGFGRVRGRFNWFLDEHGALNRLQADLNLYPSNLSEIATLIEGHDIGIHGTVSSHVVAEGKLDRLALRTAVQFGDLHRWDLLPSSGNEWTLHGTGTADLNTQRLALSSTDDPANPLSLSLNVTDFLTRPDWALAARFHHVPAANLLPIGRRMGLSVPAHLALEGSLDGQLALTRGRGLEGNATLTEASATLPDLPPVHTDAVAVRLQQDRLHFDPADLTTPGGTLQVGGDISLLSPRAAASISVQEFPIAPLRSMVAAWFGLPPSVNALSDGTLSGQLSYRRDQDSDPSWSGHFQFAAATLRLPGISVPLRQAEGRVALNGDDLELSHFVALAGSRTLRAHYRYSSLARRPERLHLYLSATDLFELQTLLAPTIEPQNWLARLRVAHRSLPVWLANRNMEGDLIVERFLASSNDALGTLMCRFVWRGANLRFPSVTLKLPTGIVSAQGDVGFDSYIPQYAFKAHVKGFEWRNGTLDADGQIHSSGTGSDLLRHLQANGTFAGANVNFAPDSVFPSLSGRFLFSFADGWPNLHFSELQCDDEDENSWTGEGTTESDGKLTLQLEHAGEQRRVVSSLELAPPIAQAVTSDH